MSGSLRGPLQFFHSTRARPCPYIAGRFERSIAAELAAHNARDIYDSACQAGFRRSHGFIYRPACPSCNACVPVRVLADQFRPLRTLDRVGRRNRDLAAVERPAEASAEQFALFSRYQKTRHASDSVEGGMDRMSFLDYQAMVEESPVDTRLIEHRDSGDRLVAAMLCDRVADGYSAVYSFFDPAQSARSPGTYMVLDLIERAQAAKLPYVYLGYWIAQSPKMSYKSRFQPMQRLGPDGWAPLMAEPRDTR